MRSFTHKFAAIAAFALAVGAAHAATPSHLYKFSGNFVDTFAGPEMVSNGGTLSAGSYHFAANEGLVLDGALSANLYTIDMSFKFDQTDGYRRILDFKNGGVDTGLYNLSSALNFYTAETGAGGAFANGQQVRVTVSRDAAGSFAGYVNGMLQFAFTDSGDLASFDTANQRAVFFQDDNQVGGEASAGSVDYIAIYDQALSGAEIATLTAPVPEPESYILMLAGLLTVAAVVKRRACS